MTPDEQELIRLYLAGGLSPQGADLAELLVLIDREAAAMVESAIQARDDRATPAP